MKLHIEQSAAKWYKEQLQLESGEYVRIYVRLGGCGSVHPGLSLGVTKDTPLDIGLEHVTEDVHFYIEKDNLWYLENKDLTISFDAATEEVSMKVQ